MVDVEESGRGKLEELVMEAWEPSLGITLAAELKQKNIYQKYLSFPCLLK